jgi:hypothetical protein
VGNN